MGTLNSKKIKVPKKANSERDTDNTLGEMAYGGENCSLKQWNLIYNNNEIKAGVFVASSMTKNINGVFWNIVECSWAQK